LSCPCPIDRPGTDRSWRVPTSAKRKRPNPILGISFKTAESHRTRIVEKLDIHETASLVRYAVRHGLVQP